MEKQFPERMLRCIIKRLFKESVNISEIRQLYRILDGPNGPYFVFCVERQYMSNINHDKTDFIWIMAVIQMHRLEGDRELIMAAARRMMKYEVEKQSLLLGKAMMSLQLRLDLWEEM